MARVLARRERQHGQQILFSEFGEPARKKSRILAGRIDALNQARLAREEQDIESQQTKLRE